MDWAKVGSAAKPSTSKRLSTTRDLRVIRSSPFALNRKGHLPRAQIAANYTCKTDLIKFIKRTEILLYKWAGQDAAIAKKETANSRALGWR
jgi:hypothetical protein